MPKQQTCPGVTVTGKRCMQPLPRGRKTCGQCKGRTAHETIATSYAPTVDGSDPFGGMATPESDRERQFNDGTGLHTRLRFPDDDPQGENGTMECTDCSTSHRFDYDDHVMWVEREPSDDPCHNCAAEEDFFVVDEHGRKVGSDQAYDLAHIYTDDQLDGFATHGPPDGVNATPQDVEQARALVHEHDLRDWTGPPDRQFSHARSQAERWLGSSR